VAGGREGLSGPTGPGLPGRIVLDPGRAAERLSLAEACERLPAPESIEDFAALTGRGVAVVELVGEAPQAALEVLEAALPRLPCPTLALAPDPGQPCAARIAPAFDVVVGGRAEVDAVLRGVLQAPLAAAALVRLLRGAPARDLEAGLAAESWVYSTLQAGPEFAAWLASRNAQPAPPSPGPPLRVERSGRVLRLTLDRPERRNAYSAALRDALCEALVLAVRDPSIETIRLEGAGPCFSAGGDLAEFGTHPDPATAHAIRTTRSAARWLAQLAPRLDALVHGACLGAGIELPAFAARITAREDAFFALPELGMGLIPGAGGTVSLPARIGRQRTAWLALSGARIDAEAALAWGLVDRVVAAGEAVPLR
jgi:enoyl-CoA hydratase/carnithine racemase